ncbi:MAG: HAD family hydrolase [Campylobacteraceae bacterium]|nr:HAD family hydrolase [Campylobacteraceae bacterium]
MKAILFDLDGTLIDCTDGIVESFEVAFSTCSNTKVNKDDICSLIGYPLEYMFESLGANKSKIDLHVKKYREHYRKIFLQSTKLLPQAKEAIELAHTLAPVGLVTTKPSFYAKEILEHFDILKFFKVIVGVDDVKNPKPDAEPILKALHTMGVKADLETFMVGDTVLDLQSAKNAKINSIALLCGYGHKKDLLKYSSNIKPDAFEAVISLKNNL